MPLHATHGSPLLLVHDAYGAALVHTQLVRMHGLCNLIAFETSTPCVVFYCRPNA